MDNISFPKVSVMIPVYNASEFIIECLESILSQDYKNIELVVSDDCSTDGTQDILKNYAGNEKVKLYLNERNLGVTTNCNQALRECTGEYICFFAGDDVMLPYKISSQVQLMESDSDASMCYHQVDVFDSESNNTLYKTESGGRTIFSFFDILEKGGLPGINSIMARKDCIPPNLYDTRFPVVSDWLFMTEIALRGKILFIDEVYTKYRKHIGGASMKADNLLDETLWTLDYISNRYNGNSQIGVVCRKSRVRHLLGSLYRSLVKRDKKLISELIGRFYRNKNFFICVLVFIYAHTVLHFEKLNTLVCFSITKTFGRK